MTTIAGGVLQYGTNNALPSGANAGNVTVNGTLNVAGNSGNINGLWGGGTIDDSVGGGSLIVGNNNATSTFSGTIQNSAGALSLTKTGAGTVTLAGTGTYAGVTTVAGGVLFAAANTALLKLGRHR